MKKLKMILLTTCTLFTMLCTLTINSLSLANEKFTFEIPSSFNPIGSGAKALSMGGAFIAICDDATASSWNPAGLIQLQYPEVSFVVDYIPRRKENVTFYSTNNWSGRISNFKLNYLSMVVPFSDQMTMAIAYQNLYNLDREWDTEFIHPDYLEPVTIKQHQNGDLYALGFSLCYDFNPLTFGITINNWDNNKWEQENNQKGKIGFEGINTIEHDIYKNETYTFKGWNFHIGFLWDITKNKNLRLAGVIKTPFKADINHTTKEFSKEFYYPENKLESEFKEYENSEKLCMPLSYGIGLAHRFLNKKLWISFDIYRTHWNDYELEDKDGTKRSPINWKKQGEYNVDPTTWFRLGFEYKEPTFKIYGKTTAIKFRGGIFYDPAPADNSPDDYYGFALGGGISYEWLVFDLAYQFRFGNNVGESMYPGLGFSQDIKECKIYASVVLHMPCDRSFFSFSGQN